MRYSAVVMMIGACLLMAQSSYSQTDSGCSEIMCRMYCPYGFKQDSQGCSICECNAKTEIKEGQCPVIDEDIVGSCSEACAHDGACPSTQKCCSNGCGHACTDIVRKGYCPVSTSVTVVGTCDELCSMDSECTENVTHKCCENACGGHSCVPPDAEKRGTCPVQSLPEGVLGICADLCSRDADCPTLQKCCSNGCGHVCTTPSDLPVVHAGSCPAAPPQEVGVCANLCENDGGCKETQKCCQNSCEGYSCVDVDVPATCDGVICLIWCAYGFKQNDNGCDICECAEPTVIHEGECPVEGGDVGTCIEECDHDGNCEDNQKCCSNGCGHTCVPSITPDPVQGCPINVYPVGEIGTCVEECSTDTDCENGERCCSNGCGHACTKPVTVHDGTCPTGDLQLGWSGICVEMCNNDGECATNQKCCSNGCGHVCINVDTPPEGCPEFICLIFCEYGNKVDKNGCIICECQESTEAGVERPGECPVGLLNEGISGICVEECSSDNDCTDKSKKCCSNGCGHVCTDALIEPQCPPILCTLYCEYGFEKDGNGCDICKCSEERKCDNIECRMYCSYGFKEDKDTGCNICECEDKPTKCPDVTCRRFCAFGFQRDADGCEICECTPNAIALNIKEGTCPAVGDPPASCADLCDNDSECAAKDKCCSNGCGHVCMDPKGSASNILVSPIVPLVLTAVSILASLQL